SHVAVTRAMLRHMLFPVWMRSVEKYADLQPQQMLQRVAAGNDARNFVFCLNKADQLDRNGRGPDASTGGGDLSASAEARERRAVPLVERVAPKVADDPANRAALADDILADRVARWPLVNLVHTIMAPLFVLVRTMGAKNVTPLQGAEALIEFHVKTHGWSP